MTTAQHVNYDVINAHSFYPQHINRSSTLNTSPIVHNNHSVMNQQQSFQPGLTLNPQQSNRHYLMMNQQPGLTMSPQQSVQSNLSCYDHQQTVQPQFRSSLQQQVHGSPMQPNNFPVANQPTNFIGQNFNIAHQGSSQSNYQYADCFQSSRQDLASLQNASFQSNQNYYSQNTNQFSRQGACLQNHHGISQQQNFPQQIHNSQYDYQQHHHPVQAVHGYPLQGNDMPAGKKL